MSKSQGKTRIKPFKEQIKFLNSDKRYYGYVSGVGAGKTFAGIVRTIRNMTEWNVGEMGAIVAPTRQMVVNVIIPEMRDLGLFDDPVNWEYKSAYSDEPGIHTPEGSRALILSADNKQTIERLRGLNLSWGWIDEEAVVEPRAREILMQRLRTGDYRNMFITTTPKGKNHTYDFFVGDVDAEQSEHGQATVYETDDRRAIVGVPSEANPHTPDDYKDAMRSDLPDALVAQEVEGNFVEIGSGIFTRDTLDFVHATELPERELRYYIGVDIGVESDASRAEDNDTDYWCACLLAVDKLNNQAWVVDMHRERGMSLRQGVEWLASISSTVPNPHIFVETVHAQEFFFQECQQRGLNVAPVDQSVKKEDRIVQLSIPLESGRVKFVDRDVDESLGYDPRWREFVQEMLSWPEGSHDDQLDALEIVVSNADFGGTEIMGANPYGDD